MAAPRVLWLVLTEVGRALSDCRDPSVAFSEVGRLVVPLVAQCCVLYLAADEQAPGALEVAHPEGIRANQIRDRLRRLLSHPGSHSRLPGLLTANEVWSQDSGDEPWLLAELGLPRGTVAPIRTGAHTRGLLVLEPPTAGLDPDHTVAFAGALADRLGLELERAAALRRSERAVATSALAMRIVSHDLGDPLAAIHICANALLDPEPQPAGGVREIAGIIHRSAAWMQQIIRDLLDRLRLDAGGVPLTREATAVADVMGTARAMFVPVAGDQGLDFTIECASDLPPVDADPHRLQQALSNLLSNAMKFTPVGGRVVLSARVAEGHEPGIRFAVSDTGPGIPAEDLPHVFDWFWHSQVGEGHTGTGLGLAIAKGMVEAHSAHLMVDSAPGCGTTFWFTLPVCAPSGAEGGLG